MRKPTQMEAFDALYGIAADDGRGAVLFGDSIQLARPAYERTLIGDGYPDIYLEFPLMGSPCFDFLSVHHGVEPGARFAAGAGYGRQELFDWFSSVCMPDDVLCGFELDTSVGETERAGVYLQQRTHIHLVEPFLASIGELARAQNYLDMLARLPKGWQPSYVGLFPGRPDMPLRIGGYMAPLDQRRCAADPAHLGKRFERIGFSAYDSELLERCSLFMRLAPSVDYQFDIMADGSLGSTFGLSLSFNKTRPHAAHACMTTDYGAKIMGLLQDLSLADERWRLIADAATARRVDYVREDGSEGCLALCVLFNFAKVKFVDGMPQPAKFYLKLRTSELVPIAAGGGA